MLSVEEQLHVISSGVDVIVPAEALKSKLASGRPLVVKLGVDPTAPDLHLGHAVPLRKLRQFQDLGHRVVLIIGDFTALIGDPSGRNTTRPPLSSETVEANARTYVEQAFKILDPGRTVMLRNSAWLASLGFADVLRLAASFTVARILEREDFRKRYEGGRAISLHEFLYPVAQAYDSVAIRDAVADAPQGADVEIGGSDQLFNLLAGRELMEKSGMQPQVCLTLPLLEGTDGIQKMSKSYGNYIGLTDEPADMFGKVMSIPDGLVVKYFRLATAVPVDDVDEIGTRLSRGDEEPNRAKRRLAREVVALYHGPEAASVAEESFDRVFKRHELPEDVPELCVEDLKRLLPEAVDVVHLPALLREADLVASSGEGRRMIDQGGVRVGGEQVSPGTYDLSWDEVAGKVLQVGRRRFVRIV